MASFSFSFGGDDIDDDIVDDHAAAPAQAAAVAPAASATADSAFPVKGKPQLPPRRHDLMEMLARLPSKIAYSLLDVARDPLSSDAARDPTCLIRLPRRELWDVKVQLMAEEEEDDEKNEKNEKNDHELAPGLGTHDVKTGIYEGGFKSWESSVDLVKVLMLAESASTPPRPSAVAGSMIQADGPAHVIELGCGTALPSLALFHWACATTPSAAPSAAPESGQATAGAARRSHPLAFTVADYNPSVLYLVTLPNFLLTWARQQRDASPLLQQALSVEDEGDKDEHGELELDIKVKDAFCAFLAAAGISLTFLSGGWSGEFVELLYSSVPQSSSSSSSSSSTDAPVPYYTLVLGAETIYSPFALDAFSETLLSILRRRREEQAGARAVIGAKRLYFGVGGSLDDFVQRMRDEGITVNKLREEVEGVRRGVVQCLP